MALSKTTRRFTVWLALAAMLFSALSPAMASVLFSDRPDILARMLAVPAKPAAKVTAAPDPEEACPHETTGNTHKATPDQHHDSNARAAHHGNTDHSSHNGSEHTAHGIFCSFCLAASSVVSLPTTATEAAVFVVTPTAYVSIGHVRPPLANLAATRHPRDPPLRLR